MDLFPKKNLSIPLNALRETTGGEHCKYGSDLSPNQTY